MVRFCTLFLVMIVASAIITQSYSWTWYPDPQRAATLEVRWNRYKAIPVKTQSAVQAVCGQLGDNRCWKPVGRPTDKESESCDIACCHAGYLTGFCQGSVQIGTNIINPFGPGQAQYKPTINANSGCGCTNSLLDAKCGPDGSLLGIRCPVDQSACARKCCRNGQSGGHCGGFLSLKCKCD